MILMLMMAMTMMRFDLIDEIALFDLLVAYVVRQVVLEFEALERGRVVDAVKEILAQELVVVLVVFYLRVAD